MYGYTPTKKDDSKSGSGNAYGYGYSASSSKGGGGYGYGGGSKPTSASGGGSYGYGYTASGSASRGSVPAYNEKSAKKRSMKDEDGYFFKEDSDDELQITGSTPGKRVKKQEVKQEEDDEIDPLDAFMSGIETTAKKQVEEAKRKDREQLHSNINKRGIRDDIENLDDEEQYFKWVEENPDKCILDPEAAEEERQAMLSQDARAHLEDEEAEELIKYDGDGHIHVTTKKKDIDALPIVYHSQMEYKEFQKNFYKEHETITELTKIKSYELREKLELKVTSTEKIEKPVCAFAHLSETFDADLMKTIRSQRFTEPTPIQSQALPSALSGRDVIGIAKTGSGKTLAFAWPALVHAAAQPRKPKEGPIVLIVSPTRELGLQTYQEIKKYAGAFGLKAIPLYGGGTMWEQAKHCQKVKPEIIIGTPGRLMDHVKKGNISLKNVTFFTLDEADRMFDMGFEYQVRSICNQIRPDRQGLLFSATFAPSIEKLCIDVLQKNHVKIVAGDGPGQMNKKIAQTVRIVDSFEAKLDFVMYNYVGWTSEGGLLVFVTKKDEAEKVGKFLKAKYMRQRGMEVGVMHGDMTQYVRNDVLQKFRLRQIACLVATDVAARGLDISHLRNVVCFTAARNLDTHVHRVGRTGRAGQTGRAYILIDQNSRNDVDFTEKLIEYLGKYVTGNPPKELKIIIDEAEQREKDKKAQEDQAASKPATTDALSYSSSMKYSHTVRQVVSTRPSDFRHEFLLPGSEASERAAGVRTVPKSSTSSSSKKYMSKFVKASEGHHSLTKERAAELMKNNPTD